MKLLLITAISIFALQALAAPNPTGVALNNQPRQETSTITASSSSTASPTSTASGNSGTLTGAFTAQHGAGGVYAITSVSGYVQVAGHSLSVGGPNALVGGVIVTEASNGFIADGATISLISVTSSSATAATTTSSSAASSTTTSARQSAATTGGASTTSNVGMAAATGAPLAMLGGMMGLLLL